MLQPATVSSASSSLRGESREGLGLRAVAGGRRRCRRRTPSRIASDSGSRPRKGTPSSAGRRFRAAAAERVGDLAAMRADVARHILDEAEHRHVHLAEQVDRPRRVDQRQVLRGRDDHRAGRPRFLDQRQLHVAGAGRQVDDQHARVSPQSPSISWPARPSPSARARRARARAKPAGRATAICTPCASTGNQSARPRPSASSSLPSKRRLRRAVDVGVDQPDLLARSRQRDGEIGGDASTCRRRPCRCRRR